MNDARREIVQALLRRRLNGLCVELARSAPAVRKAALPPGLVEGLPLVQDETDRAQIISKADAHLARTLGTVDSEIAEKFADQYLDAIEQRIAQLNHTRKEA
jgi:hypothetical protein